MLSHNSHHNDERNRRAVMRILLVGFGMVLLILGVATLVAVREKGIRHDALEAMKNHLLHAQLLHEVQAQEDVLALILHRLTTKPSSGETREKFQDLIRADQKLQELAGQIGATSQSESWEKLAQASREFSKNAQSLMDLRGDEREAKLDALFLQHDQVVKMIHDLIQHNIADWVAMDEEMRRELDDLTERSTIMLASCFLLALIFAGSTVLIARKSIERIQWQRDELNRVSWHMLQTQEDTARRFSHELHDELGQSLAAIRANLVSPQKLEQEQRNDCIFLVDEAIANVRELSQLLRPVILDDFGLEAGLRWLLERFGQRSRIDVVFHCSLPTALPAELETHLFRIAQEALTNIARHSQATSVEVNLRLDDEHLTLVIEDNGVGLPLHPGEKISSLGIIGMRARARECGGSMELGERVPHGLRVKILIPRTRVTAR
jgi:signal transduction histidine kinase